SSLFVDIDLIPYRFKIILYILTFKECKQINTTMPINYFLEPDKFVPQVTTKRILGGNPVDNVRFPTFVISPFIEGIFEVNSRLVLNPGRVVSSPMPKLSYQWTRNEKDIEGATGTSYVIRDADIGSVVSLKITAKNSQGETTVIAYGNRVQSEL